MKEGEESPSLPSPQSLARLRLARSFRSCPLPPLRGHRGRGWPLRLCRQSPRLHRSPAPTTPPSGVWGCLSKTPAAPYPCPQRLSTAPSFQYFQSHHSTTSSAFPGATFPLPQPHTPTTVTDFPLPRPASTSPPPKNPHIFQFFFQIFDKNRISIHLYI